MFELILLISITLRILKYLLPVILSLIIAFILMNIIQPVSAYFSIPIFILLLLMAWRFLADIGIMKPSNNTDHKINRKKNYYRRN